MCPTPSSARNRGQWRFRPRSDDARFQPLPKRSTFAAGSKIRINESILTFLGGQTFLSVAS